MKLIVRFLAVSILLLSLVFICGCAEMVGAVAGGVVAGLTNDEQAGLNFADAVTRSIKEEQARQEWEEKARQEQVAQQKEADEIFAQLPEKWRCPGSDYYKTDDGCYAYAHPNNGPWYKYANKKWALGE